METWVVIAQEFGVPLAGLLALVWAVFIKRAVVPRQDLTEARAAHAEALAYERTQKEAAVARADRAENILQQALGANLAALQVAATLQKKTEDQAAGR
jgi:hypothetical protein